MLFISVINHHHDEIICNNPTLSELAKQYTVIIKSNTLASNQLRNYCSTSDIKLIQGTEFKGFSANNNEVFHYAINNLDMRNEDLFLVLNPDVKVDLEMINRLIDGYKQDCEISAINLFLDENMKQYDNSIRKFPSIFNPFKSLLRIKRNDKYDKDKITSPCRIDWAAGSFLLFKSGAYKKLNGFDENFFMYFEDVDICKRAHNLGMKICYFPDIKAIHFASHKNQSILSKHALWYWTSSFRYFFKHQ